MEHHIDTRKKAMMGFIEILNDLGLNVIYIDGTFYVFTDFQPIEPDAGITYVTLTGKNITADVENAIQKEGYTPQMKTELFQRIGIMKDRRREFDGNISWKKYLADV